MISVTPRSRYLYDGPEIGAHDADEVAEILLHDRLVEMIFRFEIGDDFRRQFALAVERPSGGETQKNKGESGDDPDNDYGMNEALQQ